ncbi:unnamed protein product [Kuraishia capsulata CBS 1993]|uniref:DNA mismatch repair protein HSM3 n=1 Tax=Kuraishia capsulata CBS 1993 TaxID=1382522 RepID=W6MIJ6_9ASCO|nr:uncharacterized protein KUCA_T00001942001 [Kuraishia capsulata CBS 1993]CDK25971.1 unnamed protein product [Kuraishia capsulata CBS 1993]
MTDPVISNLAQYIQQSIDTKFNIAFDETLVLDAIQKLKTDRDLTVPDGKPDDFVQEKIVEPLVQVLQIDIAIEIKQLIVQLLEAVFTFFTFDQVLVATSLSWLIDGLQSQFLELELLCLNIIVRASPADVLANTPIIKIILTRLSQEDSPLALVNAIEVVIQELLPRGELIQRRVKSDEIVSILVQMTQSDILRARLCDLLVILVPYTGPGELPPTLFVQPLASLEQKDDPLAIGLVLGFYSKILDYAEEKPWLVESLWPAFDEIVASYLNGYIHENSMFLEGDASALVGKMSYLPGFSLLDGKHNILKTAVKNVPSYWKLLSLTNPLALLETQKEFVETLTLKAATVPIYENLLSNELSFTGCPISGRDILKLPAPLNYRVIHSVAEYPHGRHVLLTKWSQVMSFILDESHIVETEIWQLKLDTIQLLLLYPTEEEKGIWNRRLLRLYSQMKGATDVQATVASATA